MTTIFSIDNLAATRLWDMRQKQILNLEGYNLSVDQIEVMCQKYRELGQVGKDTMMNMQYYESFGNFILLLLSVIIILCILLTLQYIIKDAFSMLRT